MNTKSIPSILLLSAGLLLCACGKQEAPISGPVDHETIRYSEMVYPNDKGEVKRDKGFKLLFKANSEIPYVSIKEGFNFLNVVKGVHTGDTKNERFFYKVSKEDNGYVVVNEAGTKAHFNVKDQTVLYDDFDAFCALTDTTAAKPLALLNVPKGMKSIALTSSEFTKGNAVTVNLKNYDGIDLYDKGEELYMPLTTFNDMFLNVTQFTNLAYNYQDLFLLPNDSLVDRSGSTPKLTKIGEAFFSGPKKATLTEELKKFHYQETCLNFDYFYGLKADKGFASFASFIQDKGFKGDFENSDTKKADAALRYAVSHLVDGHTAVAVNSPLYGFGELDDDPTRMDATRTKWVDDGEVFSSSRAASTSPLGNHLSGDVYFISFNSFAAVNESLLYSPKSQWTAEAIATQTALQFSDAYSFLTAEANKGKAKTVVVDLATNDGGAADALIYGLSTLIGEVKTIVRNPLSGAVGRASYKADINLDGKVDEKDVPLIDKGYNIMILDSRFSFSSANAFPALAKANNAKVKTVGEKSAGGACVVREVFSGLGASYATSGLTEIVTEEGGKLVNVDKGVPADLAVEGSKMLDRSHVVSVIDNYLQGK